MSILYSGNFISTKNNNPYYPPGIFGPTGPTGPTGPNGIPSLVDINAVQITSALVNNNNGYTIATPGNYVVIEDILFNPVPITGSAIVSFINGGGTGASGFSAVSNGIVRGVFITNGGTGYTSVPTVSFSGVGNNAAGTAFISNGKVVNVEITNGGSGYSDTVQAAITIQSSNVHLRLGNSVISQNGISVGGTVTSSQVPFVCGIVVSDTIPTNGITDIGVESVRITGNNAIVNGFSMIGIYVQGHTYDVQISDITIKNCGLLAALENRPFQGYLPNGFPNQTYPIQGTMPFCVGGLCIGETDFNGLGPYFFTQNSNTVQNSVSQIKLNNVSCLHNYYLGACFSNITNLNITDCHFDDTFCNDPSLFVIGCAFGISTIVTESPNILNLVVRNSTCNNTNFKGDYTTQITGNVLLSGVCIGCYISNSQNISFSDSHFDNINSTFGNSEQLAYIASFVSESVNTITWDNCTFSDVSSLGYPQGLVIDDIDQFFNINGGFSRNIRLMNCKISNIQLNNQYLVPLPDSTSLNTLAGLNIEFSKNIYIENCTVSDIICNGPASNTSDANGIIIIDGKTQVPDYETDNIVIKNSQISHVVTHQGGNVKGIRLSNQNGSMFAIRSVNIENCYVQGCISSIPTYSGGLVQGTSIGFQYDCSNGAIYSYPITYTNCKAVHNKGVHEMNTGSINYPYLRSAGFHTFSSESNIPVKNHIFNNCYATDNVYGFLFSNVMQCVVRNCQADLNVDISGYIGEGFTDLGTQTSTFSGTVNTSVVTPSTTIFALDNSASSIDSYYNGQYVQFNSGVNTTPVVSVAQISNYIGANRQITLVSPLPNIPNNGDQVIIYTKGTFANPLQSLSLYEKNKSVMNGNALIALGQNGNYNVKYGSGGTDFVPVLTGNLSTPTAIGGSYFPQVNTFDPVHNISITLS